MFKMRLYSCRSIEQKALQLLSELRGGYEVIMTDELKPVRCGCGGEANVKDYKTLSDETAFYVSCRVCDTSTRSFLTKEKAIQTWNKAMGERTANVEKVDTNSPHSQVYKCCKCGQYTHRTAWSRDVHYCPSCGAKLEWE